MFPPPSLCSSKQERVQLLLQPLLCILYNHLLLWKPCLIIQVPQKGSVLYVLSTGTKDKPLLGAAGCSRLHLFSSVCEEADSEHPWHGRADHLANYASEAISEKGKKAFLLGSSEGKQRTGESWTAWGGGSLFYIWVAAQLLRHKVIESTVLNFVWVSGLFPNASVIYDPKTAKSYCFVFLLKLCPSESEGKVGCWLGCRFGTRNISFLPPFHHQLPVCL